MHNIYFYNTITVATNLDINWPKQQLVEPKAMDFVAIVRSFAWNLNAGTLVMRCYVMLGYADFVSDCLPQTNADTQNTANILYSSDNCG